MHHTAVFGNMRTNFEPEHTAFIIWIIPRTYSSACSALLSAHELFYFPDIPVGNAHGLLNLNMTRFQNHLL